MLHDMTGLSAVGPSDYDLVAPSVGITLDGERNRGSEAKKRYTHICKQSVGAIVFGPQST